MAIPDEPVSGVGGGTNNAAGMLPFQVQFIKNLIDESLDEFRYEKHFWKTSSLHVVPIQGIS